MKLLVVDHNAIEPANRILYGKIVDLGGIDLRLIVPSSWYNNCRMVRYSSPKEKPPYGLFSCNVLFRSRTHRLVYLSLLKHLREFRPDVLYMNAEPENFQTFEAALLTRSSNVKLVFSSWRNIDYSVDSFPYRFNSLHRVIERSVLRQASHALVFNRAAKSIFEKLGFHNTTFIPPPVDTALFKPHHSLAERQAFVIGYVGRLIEAKGVDLIIRAMSSLPENCSLLIVGNGPAKSVLQNLAHDLGVDHRVSIREAVSSEQVPQVLAQMDVLVLPSKTTRHWKEQFGRVLIEAMACWVPVIGSTSGEIPNVIEDAGFIFKEGSVEGLRLGIDRLLQNPSIRIELQKRGLERVNAVFSIQIVANQCHKLFTTL